MNKETYKQLNLTLSSGLFVLNVKMKKNAPIATVYLTDHTNNARIVLDTERRVMLVNRQDIDIAKKDVELILAAIEVPKKIEEKVVV